MLKTIKPLGLTIGLASTMLLANTIAAAQESKGYTLASVEGNYAIVAAYSGGVAGQLGVSKTDKNGNVEGSAVVNIPGPNNDRQVIPFSWTGVQTVNENGTGTVSLLVTLPNGTQTVTLDFVITKAIEVRGLKKALELKTMQREPSGLLAGEFVTDVLTRRPD